MPYLSGDRTVDASGNGLLDAVNNALQTPPFDFTQLINWARGLYDSVVGVGQGDFFEGIARMATSVITGNPDWLAAGYTDPEVTNSYSRIGFLYNWLEPGMSDPASIRTQLLNAIGLVRTDEASPHAPTINDVLLALAAAPEVTLPDPAPAGYGGPTVENIWGHYLNDVLGEPVTADEGVSVAWKLGNHFRRYGHLPLYQTRDFAVDFSTVFGSTYATGFSGITCDYTDILADDTVLSWLTRTDTSGRVWEADPTTGLIFSETNLGDEYHTRITCTLTDADLQAIRAGYAQSALTLTNVPPVWPGIANVTLSTPVALAAGVTITEPMDGVLIALTSVPAGTGYYGFDGHLSYTHLGAVAFFTDDGQIETAQQFSFDGHILLTKGQVRAAGCYIRCKSNVVGTAIPWVITST